MYNNRDTSETEIHFKLPRTKQIMVVKVWYFGPTVQPFALLMRRTISMTLSYFCDSSFDIH